MRSMIPEDQCVAQLELARQLLLLEQQLDAYHKLYEEEMEQIRRSLVECRKKLLTLGAAGQSVNRGDLRGS